MQFLDMQEAERMKYLAAALSSIGDGLIITDRQSRVRYINAAGERLTGWKSSEAEEKPFEEIFLLADYFSGEPLESPIWAALTSNKTVGLQNHSALITREGKTLFVSASCSPVHCDGKEPVGAVVVFRDIDRVKSMEEEIRKEKNNLKNVLEALPTGIVLINEDACVNWVNKPLLDMFHLRRKSVIGKLFGDAIHCIHSFEKGCGRGKYCRLCEIRQSIADLMIQEKSSRDITIRRTFIQEYKEYTFWLQINFIPLSGTDEKQIVVAINDITEQKNYENALQKSRDEAQSANKVKSEFLANMSHEIRTPLNGLIGMMDLLMLTDTNEVQKEYIRMAKLSANSLLKVINDILDFSKLEAGKISVAKLPFDLKSLMEEIVEINRVLAEKKRLGLQYYASSEVPRFVQGDPDRLRQMLNNLVGNAIKFTETGQIGINVINLGQSGENLQLEFSVKDSGIGISPENMELLFKRFSQVDGSNTRRYNGTGLGLAICRQLAELMGGTILAESEPGKGSVFRLLLSLRPVNETAMDSSEGYGCEAGHPNSLVVLDGSEVNKFISEEAGTEPIIILDPLAETEKCNRVRLGENGEILFNSAGPSADTEHAAQELEGLELLLYELRELLEEEEYDRIEASAHKIKKIALRIDDDELMDIAFRTELAARKNRWDTAEELCLKMLDLYHKKYRA